MHNNVGKSKFASVVATGLIMKIYCIYDLKFVETPNVHYDFIPDIHQICCIRHIMLKKNVDTT